MDRKQWMQSIFFPPVWLVLFLIVLSGASLALVFVKGWERWPIAAVVYALAFYTLLVFCLACLKTFPEYDKDLRRKLYANKYAYRYLTDAAFKTHVNLYRSLAINLLYVLVNAISAVVYHTHWFAIFAVYYMILVIMRFLLVCYVGKNKIGQSRLGELQRARLCACILLTVNLALSGAVLMMVYFHRGFEYQGFLIYVMALYTFYITTTAVIDIIRYRKYNSPILSMSNAIKLAAALVSMLSLETAMFSQFGGDTSPETQRIMIMATGGGIAVIVVGMAAYFIVCTTKEIREIRRYHRNDRSSK